MKWSAHVKNARQADESGRSERRCRPPQQRQRADVRARAVADQREAALGVAPVPGRAGPNKVQRGTHLRGLPLCVGLRIERVARDVGHGPRASQLRAQGRVLPPLPAGPNSAVHEQHRGPGAGAGAAGDVHVDEAARGVGVADRAVRRHRHRRLRRRLSSADEGRGAAGRERRARAVGR